MKKPIRLDSFHDPFPHTRDTILQWNEVVHELHTQACQHSVCEHCCYSHKMTDTKMKSLPPSCLLIGYCCSYPKLKKQWISLFFLFPIYLIIPYFGIINKHEKRIVCFFVSYSDLYASLTLYLNLIDKGKPKPLTGFSTINKKPRLDQIV